MPFDDWTFNLFGTAVTAGIQAADPIVGSGSLQFTDTFTGSLTGGFTAYITDVGSRAFTKGRIRTLIRFDDYIEHGAPSGESLTGAAILWCMSSAANPNSANSYSLRITPSTTGSFPTDNFRIVRNTSTILSTVPTIMNTGTKALDLGEVLPIEFEWNLDQPGIGGIALVARAGNIGDTDYSNLATVCGVSEFTTNLMSTMSEGIGYVGQNQTTVDLKFDQTDIFSGV